VLPRSRREYSRVSWCCEQTQSPEYSTTKFWKTRTSPHDKTTKNVVQEMSASMCLGVRIQQQQQLSGSLPFWLGKWPDVLDQRLTG
jgi:hypothetical protein